jgi:acyl dehydratase
MNNGWASLASPGIDELRWATPLRAGEPVRLRTTILSGRPRPRPRAQQAYRPFPRAILSWG